MNLRSIYGWKCWEVPLGSWLLVWHWILWIQAGFSSVNIQKCIEESSGLGLILFEKHVVSSGVSIQDGTDKPSRVGLEILRIQAVSGVRTIGVTTNTLLMLVALALAIHKVFAYRIAAFTLQINQF